MTLVATLVQESRPHVDDYDGNELRYTQAGCFNAHMKQTNGSKSFVNDELRKAVANSNGRTLKISAINYKDVSVRTSRPIMIPDSRNTSVFYTVVFFAMGAGFKMLPREYDNNEIGYLRDFAKHYKAINVAFLRELETKAATSLEAFKTSIIGEVTGGHTFAGDIVSEVAKDFNSSYILSDIDGMMQSNDFLTEEMDIIGNQGANSMFRRMEGFGSFNAENKNHISFGKNFHFSNSIPNAGTKKATGFAVADGNLAFLSRVERDALAGTRLRTGHEWGIVDLPIGIKCGSYYYEEVVDASGRTAGTTDMERTGAECFDFAFEGAFIHKHVSDPATIPTPCFKFDIDVA